MMPRDTSICRKRTSSAHTTTSLASASSIDSVNATKNLITTIPTEKRVASWVAQAGKLDRIVGH